MKKRILSLLLAICMVLSLVPTMVFAEGDSHTVTVNAGKGGKVSTDGISWTNSVSVTLDDGETLDGKVQYKSDEGYAFDSVVPKIVSVAAGYQHTVLLDANGNVWTSGANDFGQLGRETSSDRDSTSFTQVTVGDGVKIKAIAADGSHTVLLDENGNVWTAGSNYYGQLGKDENKETNNANPTFKQVTIDDGVKIKAIAAGGHYTVLLDEEGNVWTAGRNNYGQLGRDENKETNNANPTFTQVTDGIVITAIAAGNDHTVLLDEEGNVWTSGNNSNGQLGRETNSDIDSNFAQVTGGIGGVKITAIAAGNDHTVLLDEDGNVWTAGRNDYGQLGRTANYNPNPTFTQVTVGDGVKIKAIAAGNEHTVLLDENNNVWTAGQNKFGQLGRETSSVNDSTFAKVTNGIGGVKITATAANFIQTILLDEKGNVWTAGDNEFGQLGRDENVGTNNANPIFKQAPVAITFDELLNTPIYTDSVFLVKFKDANLVTVNAGEGGKVSTDGISWTNSVSVTLDDGETLDGKVQYKADEGYIFDGVAPKIVSVATGDNHTVLLDANGNVWTAGKNSAGQLGRETSSDSDSTFTQVTVGDGVKIKAIAAGGSHTVLLDENGNVWTAGSNYYGQLGKDENKETNNANPTFTQVTIDDGVKIKAIAASGYYTVLLDEEGNVWTAGRNDYGQLGIQTGSNINSTFIQVTFDIVITAIAAGGYHTVLLDEEGNVWTAGLNNFGQLGRETGSNTNSTFIQVTFDIVITAIAAGGYHTVLLDDGGNVWTTGNNNHGQLGRETSYDIDARIFMQVTNGISGVKITAIAAGSDHTVLLDENNNVWTAGDNEYGQLGRETSSVNDSTFAKVTGGIGGVKITAIAARFVHTVLLDKDGNVWTAGRNYCGQLGKDENVGTDNANPTFAQPTVNPDAITFDEMLNIPIYNDSVFFVRFKPTHKVTVNAGEGGKVLTDGISWSNSVSVTLDDGETLDGKVQYKADEGYIFEGVVPKIVSVAAGYDHTVLLDAKGNVWTAGFNLCGQLGRDENKGTDKPNPTFTQVINSISGVKIKSISAGFEHTVLLDEDGNVWTAGSNSCGQLGRETSSDSDSTFTQVTVGDGVKIKAIAAGRYHTVLLDEGGNVWAAGDNSSGQLGRSDSNTSTFTQVTVSEGVTIKAIAAGVSHTVLLDESNNVWTAGNNFYGQLGRETSSNINSTFKQVTAFDDIDDISKVKIKAIAAVGYHTVLLDANDNVWTAGENTNGQLGRDENAGTAVANPTFKQVTDGMGITAIAAGFYHTVLLDKNNNVWTAGRNYYGQLGRDENVDTNNINPTFKQVTDGIGGVNITAIAAGFAHTVLLDKEGNVWTAGWNNFGQLGRDENAGTYNANPTFAQPTVNPDAITFEELLNIPIYNDSVFLVKFKDVQKPVIKGLEKNKTYCDAVEFTVSDNGGIASVTANDVELTATNGKYTIAKGAGTVKVVATDNSGNTADVTVTVNNGHTGGEATCTEKAECDYCYEEYGELDSTNHTGSMVWERNETQHKKYWNCCDAVVVGYEDHTWVDGVCSECDYICTHKDADKDHECDICGETLSDHTYEWQSENGQYWQKCSYCGDETEKKAIPAITISGADVVCKTQDYRFVITVPEGVTNVTWGYDFERMGNSGIEPTIEDGEMVGIMSSDYYASGETGFRVVVMAETADGFVFAERKSVVINSEHTDNNKDHICDICGEPLSEHTYEWQSENGQYWQKCSYCGDETAKKAIPAITIDAPDTVCKTQNCEANATIPDDITEAVLSVEFARFGGAVDLTVENGMLSYIVEASNYPDDENIFNIVIYATTADGFPLEVSKTVQIQDKHAGGKADCSNKPVCDTCGEEYGEADSTNHNLENIPAKAATVTETGNIEYWHCKACGKYFADENCENEIMLSDTIIAKLPPEIIDGMGQSVTEGEKKELSFTSNAAYGDFVGVEIDGETLDAENYTATDGSTIISLTADYVATLSAGKHTIGIVSESGTATTTFTVNAKTVDNPDTGDNSHMILWIALALVSGSAVIGTTIAGKKKKRSAR